MNRLEKLWKGLFLTLLMGTVITFSNCDDEEKEPEATETLYELLSANADLSVFKGYVDADATLKGYMEGTTEYTFFVPTNEAFAILANTLSGGTDGDLSVLDAVNPEVIGAVLRFHIGTGNLENADLPGTEIPTLAGEDMAVGGDGTIVNGGRITSVEIITTDLRATNGRMHVVGNILVPPSLFLIIATHLEKVTQPIMLGKDFTVLAAAVQKADAFADGNSNIPSLTETLTVGEYTLFVPSDATFAAADPVITVDTYTGEQWYGIISNHAMAGTVELADLTSCATFTTLLPGGELTVFNNPDVVAAANGVGVYFDSNGNVDCTLADGGASLANLDAELAVPNAFEPAQGAFHVIAGVLAP